MTTSFIRHYASVPVTDLGGSRRSPTPDEARFIDGFGRSIEFYCDAWLHEDEDGTPWMMVSFDFTERGRIRKTLRLDFDGKTIRGGWSPAALNWDGGVRAEEAAVDCEPPDGIHVVGDSVDALAQAAATWFHHHHTKQ